LRQLLLSRVATSSESRPLTPARESGIRGGGVFKDDRAELCCKQCCDKTCPHMGGGGGGGHRSRRQQSCCILLGEGGCNSKR
jgi:hypothetical protein